MIRTKNAVLKLSDIPAEWAFSYYLNIPAGKLAGGDFKISSPFSSDRNPSFSVYKDKQSGEYKFKCFSTGFRGSHLDLIIALHKVKNEILTIDQARDLLQRDYNAYLEGNNGSYIAGKVLNGKGRVICHEMRKFIKEDLDYWVQYHISHDILEEYNVAPLKWFKMEKLKDGKVETYHFEGPLLFGYYTGAGELFAIYQPTNRKNKVIVVLPHIAGLDQCRKPAKGILFTEGMKDVMGFSTLQIEGWHIVATGGTNIYLPKEFMEECFAKYKYRGTLFDDDDSGKKAAVKWQEKFGIDPVPFKMTEKDLTDNLKEHPYGLVKLNMINALNYIK